MGGNKLVLRVQMLPRRLGLAISCREEGMRSSRVAQMPKPKMLRSPKETKIGSWVTQEGLRTT